MATETKTPIIQIDEDLFDERKEDNRLTPGRGYALIRDGEVCMYAYTPDAVGAYYYDTLEEFRENHG